MLCKQHCLGDEFHNRLEKKIFKIKKKANTMQTLPYETKVQRIIDIILRTLILKKFLKFKSSLLDGLIVLSIEGGEHYYWFNIVKY